MATLLQIGSTDPELTFPPHILNIHKSLIAGADYTNWDDFPHENYGNILDDMVAASAAVGGSPYAHIISYDPDRDLGVIQGVQDRFLEAVNDIDPEEEVTSALAAVLDSVSEVETESAITAALDAAEARRRETFGSSVARVTAGMFDIGAVLNSQYPMVLALMENSFQREMNDLEAQLRLEAQRSRLSVVVGLVAEMLQLRQLAIKGYQSAAALQGEIGRTKILAKQDQQAFDLKNEVEDALWDLNLYKYPLQGIGALNGAAVLPDPQEGWERALGIVGTLGSLLLQGAMLL